MYIACQHRKVAWWHKESHLNIINSHVGIFYFECRVKNYTPTGAKPGLGPNCMIPYIKRYMVSYSSDPNRAYPLCMPRYPGACTCNAHFQKEFLVHQMFIRQNYWHTNKHKITIFYTHWEKSFLEVYSGIYMPPTCKMNHVKSSVNYEDMYHI